MSQQPATPPPATEPPKKTSTGLQENVEGLLCYLAGWVTGLIFLLIEKDSKFVRFHAVQAIILSVAFIIIGFIPIIGWFAWIVYVIAAIYCMIQAYQGKMFKLPVIGSFAEKQVNK